MVLALVTMPKVDVVRGSFGGVFQFGWFGTLNASKRTFTVWPSRTLIALASEASKLRWTGVDSTFRPIFPGDQLKFEFVKSNAAAFQ